jgi:hypothetical protein
MYVEQRSLKTQQGLNLLHMHPFDKMSTASIAFTEDAPPEHLPVVHDRCVILSEKCVRTVTVVSSILPTMLR